VEPVDELRVELDNSDLAPATARHALQPWLAGVDCSDEIVGDALIVVSELVTNVVMHTASESFLVAVFDDHRLRLEVHDHSPHAPVIADQPPGSAGGFGLPIVDSLCDAWGWEPTASGKRVWTETLC